MDGATRPETRGATAASQRVLRALGRDDPPGVSRLSLGVEAVTARTRRPEELQALFDRLRISLKRVGGLGLLRK